MNTLTRRHAILNGLSSLAALTLTPRAHTWAPPAGSGATLVPLPNTKTKLFDPKQGFGAITNIRTFTDSTIFKRGNQWCMVGGGFDIKKRAIMLLSASLPAGTPLSTNRWKLTADPNDPSSALPLVMPSSPEGWDGLGGMHCPSYARGWDPAANGGAGAWQERIYYAGSSKSFVGPYTIGYLHWDGSRWNRYGSSPVFTATEPWETPTVAEPNVIYYEGKWRMWYLAGPDKEKQYPQGYAESVDGRTGWKKQMYLPGGQNVFDNAVLSANGRFESVFSRYPLLSHKVNPEDGLWWHSADRPYAEAEHWSEPTHLLSPLDGQANWHAGGVWKPSFDYSDADPTRAFVFFNGAYADAGPFPVFTLGCIECRREI